MGLTPTHQAPRSQVGVTMAWLFVELRCQRFEDAFLLFQNG